MKPPSETSENSSLDDVVYRGTTILSEGEVDKYSIIAELTSHDYDVIESPVGWLENTVIQQAHVLLKKVNPSIQGLQRTSLGVFCNFDNVDGDFIQILHTGGNQWVCVSSIGCEDGVVNLYDSPFHGVIIDDLELQVRNLLGNKFKKIYVMPVQQQPNGSDCGVFAIAFATSFIYTLTPHVPQFHVSQMRPHLSACLKANVITPFPSIIQ